jgi:hypothetical protein
MGVTRRKFTLEFKTEAAHRVIDTGRSAHDVAEDVASEGRSPRRRGSASQLDHSSDGLLTALARDA